MKKLLILALAAQVTMVAHANTNAESKISPQEAKALTAPRLARAIVDTMATAAKAPFVYIKDAAVAIKDSDAGQDIADVAGQFATFPAQLGSDIQDGYNASVDATKTFGRKIADSRFIAQVKDANQVIVDASKKVTTRIKDAARDVANSEAVEDTKDVLGQFADAPREAWTNAAAFFTAIKSEIIN